jgi:hypothetical protein
MHSGLKVSLMIGKSSNLSNTNKLRIVIILILCRLVYTNPNNEIGLSALTGMILLSIILVYSLISGSTYFDYDNDDKLFDECRKCPYCKTKIDDEAIKCKHCMEMLD